jgi:hypothetical protein
MAEEMSACPRFAVLVLAASAPCLLTAQWLNYPTAGVPLLDGKPNLNAPAPRAAGKPDFSGVWIGADRIIDSVCPPNVACIRQEPLPIRAIDIGISSHDQVAKLGHNDGFVLTLLPYQPWAAELVKRRALANKGVRIASGKDQVDPHARCLPPNFPRAWALPQFKKIVEAPGLILILHEFNASYRQIFTDGRPLPNDPQPSWNGYSTGKWEGDTLVVETKGFRDDLWLDMTGSPMTEAAHVTERFRRPNYGTLKIEVTVNDPKAYTQPWTVQMDQSIALNTELIDDVCLENEKDVAHYTAK